MKKEVGLYCLDHFFTFGDERYAELFDADHSIWTALTKAIAFLESYGGDRIDLDSLPSSVTLVNREKIFIDPEVKVEPYSVLEGPMVVGKGSIIRQGAYLRGMIVAGEHVIFGHGVEVKRSILFDGARLAHQNYVGDSILGKGVNLGAGVVCANVRLDKGIVRSGHGQCGQREDRQTKRGAIIGDDSSIGANSVLCPGVLLPQKSAVLPCSCVRFGTDGVLCGVL